jgi:hypothetical protein
MMFRLLPVFAILQIDQPELQRRRLSRSCPHSLQGVRLRLRVFTPSPQDPTQETLPVTADTSAAIVGFSKHAEHSPGVLTGLNKLAAGSVGIGSHPQSRRGCVRFCRASKNHHERKIPLSVRLVSHTDWDVTQAARLSAIPPHIASGPQHVGKGRAPG